jgi:exodeoxyribonuclease V gamma subunit
MERGLILHRSSHVEALAERLVDSVEMHPPADPIASQEVIVGSRGMERWLRHRIATLSTHQLCCNLEFPFPEGAIQRRIDKALGNPGESDAWQPDRLAWRVLRELLDDTGPGQHDAIASWMTATDPDEKPGSVGRQSWVLARDVADVLDRLIHFRSDWLVADPQLNGQPLAPWLLDVWQRIERSQSDRHYAARLAELEALPPAATAQRPLHVFGFSAFPPSTLQALQLLARHGRVEVYAFVPSAVWWADFQSQGRLRHLTEEYRSQDRDDLARQLRDEFKQQHPLLTGLGRLSRDFQALVENECQGYHEPEWDDDASDERPTSLLAHLQSSIREATWPPASGDPLPPRDDSIQLHACHGAQRQVEVLREALLDLFERDPTLQPRDILVMTPELETYAPLMNNVFRQGLHQPADDVAGKVWGAAGAPSVPVQVSDLGIRRLNSVADGLLRVLEFAEGRMTASGLSDMLALRPVRERFGMGSEDVDTVRHWIAASGLRWGIDAEDRASSGHPEDAANTLAFALERIALGVVRADDPECWEIGIAPLDELEGSPVPLAGRAMQFLRTVAHWCEALRPATTPSVWSEHLREAVESLTATDADSSFLTGQVQETINQLASDAEAGGFDGPLRLSAVRHWLAGRLEKSVGGDRPITGAITVSAMQPMRSVPFRVIALVGMDDANFPRGVPRHGFDPTQQHPRLGDRNPRDEDRHLFLEAILSARSHFIITYTGHDDRTNESRPPSGVVHELMRVLEQGWPEIGDLTRHHPLQPFSARLFTADPTGPEPPYGEANAALAAQIIQRRGGADQGVFAGQPALPTPALAEGLSLDDLEATLRHPNRQFLRHRLGLRLRDWSDSLQDHEPVELDALERWQLQSTLLERATAAQLSGGQLSPARALERLRAEGRIPLGAAGAEWVAINQEDNQRVLEAAREHLAKPHQVVDIDLDCDGVSLQGRIDGYLPDERIVVACTHEDPREKPRQRTRLWLRTLAIAAQTGTPCRGITYGLKNDGTAVRRLEIQSPEHAEEQLVKLVALWRESMTRPLRLAEKTSFAFARAVGLEGWLQRSRGEVIDLHRALAKADDAWNGDDRRRGEGEEAELRAAFGSLPIHRAAEGPVEDEFVEFAERLWLPQLAAEID